MKKFFTIICVVFVLWVSVSFVDIVADNSAANPEHFSWNFFEIIT